MQREKRRELRKKGESEGESEGETEGETERETEGETGRETERVDVCDPGQETCDHYVDVAKTQVSGHTNTQTQMQTCTHVYYTRTCAHPNI